MALRPPSLSKEYDDFFSGDPGILQPPAPLATDATDEQRKVHEDQFADYVNRVRVARETGQWMPLVVADTDGPTIFKMRPIPGELYRDLLDRYGNARSIGPGRLNAQLFRCAVRSVSNLKTESGEEIKIELVPNPIADLREHGKIASPGIVDYLDALNPRIVTELGDRVLDRATGIAPKS